MQVYDLDKTQEWLNRTLAIRREPPVRGGVRTDHRTRRQTALGLGVVGLALLAMLLHAWLRPQEVKVAAHRMDARRVQRESVTAPPQPPDNAAALSLVLSHQEKPRLQPYLSRAETAMPQLPAWKRTTSHRTRTVVAPPAPVWLDGAR